MTRSKLVALIALMACLLALPGLGRAETVAAYAPYGAEQDEITSCDEFAGATCTVVSDADAMTGSLKMDLTIESAGKGTQPGVGTAFGQPEIIGELPMNEASKIVVTATFRINSASAFRQGTFASATGGKTANAHAIAWMNARQLTGDCDEIHGCLEPGSCALCDSSSGQATIVDLSAGIEQVSNVDITIQFDLIHPTSRFSAGTLLFFGGLAGEASLESTAVPDDGIARVSVDAVLVSVVAEFNY